MDIIFKGRHTGLQERFRRHATAKLGKIGKLDQKAIRIDVEVSQERNPRQSDRRERVELTIRSRGPVIRAEAAADDRFVALAGDDEQILSINNGSNLARYPSVIFKIFIDGKLMAESPMMNGAVLMMLVYVVTASASAIWAAPTIATSHWTAPSPNWRRG